MLRQAIVVDHRRRKAISIFAEVADDVLPQRPNPVCRRVGLEAEH
jgi:hypothetical protein